jgi:hypothetical protein
MEVSDARRLKALEDGDRESTGGVDDPQPDRHMGKVAIRSEFLSRARAGSPMGISLWRDHWFESNSLQQGVCKTQPNAWTPAN